MIFLKNLGWRYASRPCLKTAYFSNFQTFKFKVTITQKSNFMNWCLHLWLLQYAHSHMIDIQVLCNRWTYTTIAAFHGHVITMSMLHSHFPTNRINGEASNKIISHGHIMSRLTTVVGQKPITVMWCLVLTQLCCLMPKLLDPTVIVKQYYL